MHANSPLLDTALRTDTTPHTRVADKGAWTFGATVPQRYQRYLAPVLFEPYGRALADWIARETQGDVLETACGTGVASRLLRAALPVDRQLTCTDISPGMLATAREVTPVETGITWMLADASNLPFPAGRFGAVACQFGMAFVPDPSLAFKEAWRVLAPGGALYFSLWAPPETNLHSRLFDDVCQRFARGAVSSEDQQRPYALSKPPKLRAMLKRAGFADVRVATLRREGRSPSALDLATGAITGTPRAGQLAAAGVDLQSVTACLAQELAAHAGAQPCILPMRALIAIARKASQ